jgi:flavorubredoxin
VTVFPLVDDVYVISRPAEVANSIRQVNGLVINSQHPVVLDTTFPPEAGGFIEDLRSILDPRGVAFIVATHADPDHTGALVRLLLTAPQARVVTNPVGMEKLKGDFGLPEDRFLLVQPGSSIDLGDRTLQVHPVPLFDQPETMSFFDDLSRVLYTSDCFGAVLEQFVAFADEADVEHYRAGFRFWNQSNHPWIRLVDPDKFRPAVDAIRRLQPRVISSTHGPAIRQDIERALGWLEELPDSELLPFPFPLEDGR